MAKKENTEKRKIENREIRFCPKCGSENVRPAGIISITGESWACLDCGFESNFFPVKVKEK